MDQDPSIRRLSRVPTPVRRPLELLLFLGTRPEAVKLAPVALAARRCGGDVRARLVSSGQHPAAMLEVLEDFGLAVDRDLGLFHTGQTPTEVMCAAMAGLDRELAVRRPDVVLVQGDTTSALAGALAAFHVGVPVAHVEAGLRSHDRRSPFPEEMNRRLIDAVADVLFAPTPRAERNLLAEGIEPGRVFTTGNTVCDALAAALEPGWPTGRRSGGSTGGTGLRQPELDGHAGRVLVTAHRRESWGEPMDDIAAAVAAAASRLPAFQFLAPLHPNPQVRRSFLRMPENVVVTDPLPYWTFVRVLAASDLLVTDSGGALEEAACLCVPTLVLRRRTERPEALEAGIARLVGTDREAVARAIERALSRPGRRRQAPGVFGDGAAGERIVTWLRWSHGLTAHPPAPFVPLAGTGVRPQGQRTRTWPNWTWASSV